MLLLREPSEKLINHFIDSQRHSPFSYPEIAATRGELPSDYIVDHNRVQLGVGRNTFEHAINDLRQWKQFDLGWVQILPPETRIELGAVVAICAKTYGFWSLSACRIVYLINEEAPVKKFGFAYGTLADHVARGEERFTIEWHREQNSVWYDILAISRPQHPLVKLASPLARRLQRRFARDSLQKMVESARHSLESRPDLS